MRKTIIAFSILLALLLVYYLIIQVPSKNNILRDRTQVSNQLECKSESEKYSKVIQEKLDGSVMDELLNEPKFVFSEELNTCIYLMEYTSFWRDGSVNWTIREIIDIYSNKVLAEFSEHFDGSGNVNAVNGDKEKYNELYNSYFGS